MSNIDEALLSKIIKQTIEEMGGHCCPLGDIGMTDDDHKEHHKFLKKSLEDWSVIKKAFLVGVVTTLTGGIFGLIWFAIKNSPKP